MQATETAGERGLDPTLFPDHHKLRSSEPSADTLASFQNNSTDVCPSLEMQHWRSLLVRWKCHPVKDYIPNRIYVVPYVILFNWSLFPQPG